MTNQDDNNQEIEKVFKDDETKELLEANNVTRLLL